MSRPSFRLAVAVVVLSGCAVAGLTACSAACLSTPWGLNYTTGPDRSPIDEREVGDAGRWRDGGLIGCRRGDGGPLYPLDTHWRCNDPDRCTTCEFNEWCVVVRSESDAAFVEKVDWIRIKYP